MWLKRLALTHFRSYSRLGLELPPGVVVLHGANGQGKTNLLEAVYVLATTKSPRAGGDREVHVDLLLRVEGDGEATNGSGPTLSKQIRVGGLPRRAVEYVGTVNAV